MRLMRDTSPARDAIRKIIFLNQNIKNPFRIIFLNGLFHMAEKETFNAIFCSAAKHAYFSIIMLFSISFLENFNAAHYLFICGSMHEICTKSIPSGCSVPLRVLLLMIWHSPATDQRTHGQECPERCEVQHSPGSERLTCCAGTYTY